MLKISKIVHNDGTPSKMITPFCIFMFILQKHADIG